MRGADFLVPTVRGAVLDFGLRCGPKLAHFFNINFKLEHYNTYKKLFFIQLSVNILYFVSIGKESKKCAIQPLNF